MIKQFDGIELPWGKVNGTLVVSENIADNGGMAVTLAIMKDTKGANYEEYFMLPRIIVEPTSSAPVDDAVKRPIASSSVFR